MTRDAVAAKRLWEYLGATRDQSIAFFVHRYPAPLAGAPEFGNREPVMKIKNSIKALKSRHRNNRVVRRRGRIYVINKTQRRFKARQG